jgi:hypothetical protein
LFLRQLQNARRRASLLPWTSDLQCRTPPQRAMQVGVRRTTAGLALNRRSGFLHSLPRLPVPLSRQCRSAASAAQPPDARRRARRRDVTNRELEQTPRLHARGPDSARAVPLARSLGPSPACPPRFRASLRNWGHPPGEALPSRWWRGEARASGGRAELLRSDGAHHVFQRLFGAGVDQALDRAVGVEAGERVIRVARGVEARGDAAAD